MLVFILLFNGMFVVCFTGIIMKLSCKLKCGLCLSLMAALSQSVVGAEKPKSETIEDLPSRRVDEILSYAARFVTRNDTPSYDKLKKYSEKSYDACFDHKSGQLRLDCYGDEAFLWALLGSYATSSAELMYRKEG